MLRPREGRPGQLAITLGALLLLFAAGRRVEPAVDLAGVQSNGCSVTTGSGRVVTQPSANCPIDIQLGNLLTESGGAANDLAPGDTAWRPLDVRNIGATTFDRLTLSTEPGAGALVPGLRLSLRRCAVAWSPGPTGYTCATGQTTLLQQASVVQRLDLPSSPATARDGVDRLLVGLSLVTTATNSQQGSSTTMAYTFTASRN